MEKMQDKTKEVGAIISDSINGILENRERFREELKDPNNSHTAGDDPVTIKDTDIPTCGFDCVYVVKRLFSTDLLFSCALLSKGLFSMPQKAISLPHSSSSSSSAPKDNYGMFVYPLKHDAENATIAGATMLQMKIKLAIRSPYYITYVDG
jgi:hypothetical protein